MVEKVYLIGFYHLFQIAVSFICKNMYIFIYKNINLSLYIVLVKLKIKCDVDLLTGLMT